MVSAPAKTTQAGKRRAAGPGAGAGTDAVMARPCVVHAPAAGARSPRPAYTRAGCATSRAKPAGLESRLQPVFVRRRRPAEAGTPTTGHDRPGTGPVSAGRRRRAARPPG